MNGDLVKKWVKKQGLKREQLAVRLGISISTVDKILAGEDNLRYPTIIALSYLMGVKESQLVKNPRQV